MKIVLENRTRHRINKGSMKTVFEKRTRITLSGIPGSLSQDNFRVLEDDFFRVTEDGNFRLLE